MDDMHAVVTNSTVDGVLAALFAVMIIVVIADAARIWVKALRAGGTLLTFEAPKVASRLVAPAGLFPTAEDRAAMAGGPAGDRFSREREAERTGAAP
jgi:carbon starvation protein